MGHLYVCEAVGSPLPSFTWLALNINSGCQEKLHNDIPGININIEAEIEKVNTQLIISSDAEFRNATCIAENSLGQVMRNSFMMVIITTFTIGKLSFLLQARYLSS